MMLTHLLTAVCSVGAPTAAAAGAVVVFKDGKPLAPRQLFTAGLFNAVSAALFSMLTIHAAVGHDVLLTSISAVAVGAQLAAAMAFVSTGARDLLREARGQAVPSPADGNAIAQATVVKATGRL